MPLSILSSTFTFVLAARPAVYAFSPAYKSRQASQLFYRSIHHGPDVEPLTDAEKLGADFSKMKKEMITNYGPGSFDGLVDFTDQFDGGDSEMGVTGDGIVRLQTIGRDVTPHMARTTSARLQGTEPHQDIITSDRMSYTEELLYSNPSMDSVRAQQLENWAEQRELSNYNKHMYYDNNQEAYEMNVNAHDEVSLSPRIYTFIITLTWS